MLLVRATLASTSDGPASALFIFIGAEPHTGWLGDMVALDSYGFVLTGQDLIEQRSSAWPLTDRPPAWLETSLPAVFAAGDIRHGSIKRVAAAVGEGSTAAMLAGRAAADKQPDRGGPAPTAPRTDNSSDDRSAPSNT